MKIISLRTEFSKRMDRQTDMKKLMVDFCKFSNNPKKEKKTNASECDVLSPNII
jgi:hypothetical protein